VPNRTTILAIGAIIAIPAIFAALGAGQAAGIAFGVVLVAVGVVWMVVGPREGEGKSDGD
jgi:hypothetical protein